MVLLAEMRELLLAGELRAVLLLPPGRASVLAGEGGEVVEGLAPPRARGAFLIFRFGSWS